MPSFLYLHVAPPYRAVTSGGAGGALAPQFSADQLTLSRPEGTHYPHPVLQPPPPLDFQTVRQPCIGVTKGQFISECPF